MGRRNHKRSILYKNRSTLRRKNTRKNTRKNFMRGGAYVWSYHYGDIDGVFDETISQEFEAKYNTWLQKGSLTNPIERVFNIDNIDNLPVFKIGNLSFKGTHINFNSMKIIKDRSIVTVDIKRMDLPHPQPAPISQVEERVQQISDKIIENKLTRKFLTGEDTTLLDARIAELEAELKVLISTKK